MGGRTEYRLNDVVDAIEQIELLMKQKTFDDIQSNRPFKAAFERFLEILSEAARYIPDELKDAEPSIPWKKIADIGNHLRHAYHRVDAEILWRTYSDGQLALLREAAMRMLTTLKSSGD